MFEFSLQMACVLEVIIVNMMLFYANVKPRYSKRYILLVLGLFTCLIVPVGIWFTKLLGIYGDGNALFTLFGFFYLLPLHYLYEESMTKHFFVICFCWLYTLIICSISIQIGTIAKVYGRFAMTLLSETLLFVISFHYIKRFTRNIYLPLLQCKDTTLQYYLNRASLVWFLTVIMINLNFVYEQNHYLKIVTVLTICINVLYNFELIRELLKQEKMIGSLEHQVAKDFLTGAGNRLAFKNAFQQNVKEQSTFALIYLDLDHFKSINDTYGHTIGDLYLKEFSAGLKALAGRKQVFRISGDEFCVMTSVERAEAMAKKIQHLNFQIGEEKVGFRGVSYGIVNYPQDGKDVRLLLDIADKKMYDMKRHV